MNDKLCKYEIYIFLELYRKQIRTIAHNFFFSILPRVCTSLPFTTFFRSARQIIPGKLLARCLSAKIIIPKKMSVFHFAACSHITSFRSIFTITYPKSFPPRPASRLTSAYYLVSPWPPHPIQRQHTFHIFSRIHFTPSLRITSSPIAAHSSQTSP